MFLFQISFSQQPLAEMNSSHWTWIGLPEALVLWRSDYANIILSYLILDSLNSTSEHIPPPPKPTTTTTRNPPKKQLEKKERKKKPSLSLFISFTLSYAYIPPFLHTCPRNLPTNFILKLNCETVSNVPTNTSNSLYNSKINSNANKKWRELYLILAFAYYKKQKPIANKFFSARYNFENGKL